MYPSKSDAVTPNPFELALSPLTYVIQSVSSTQLQVDLHQPKREALVKAFQELEKIASTPDPSLLKTMEELGKTELSPRNQQNVLDTFRNLFESKKFSSLRKHIEAIPENQQLSFTLQLYVRIEGKLAEIRTFNHNALGLTNDKTQIKKILVFDQAILELSILTKVIIQELKNKNPNRIERFQISFIVLSNASSSFLDGGTIGNFGKDAGILP